MWNPLIAAIVRIFAIIFLEDERPGARMFSIGCLAVVLAVIGIVALIYAR